MRPAAFGRAVVWARRWGADVAGVVAAVVYGLPSLAYPFGIDQPIHWYIGRGLLRGELPYAESAVSTKPPGVFVVHALGQLVLGDAQWSIRVVDLVFVVLTGVLVATFRPRRTPPDGREVPVAPLRPGETGAATLAVSGLYYTCFDFFDAAHPELWQGFFMLASGWLIVRAPDGRVSARRAFAAGVLACLAVTFKHVAAMTGVLGGMAIVAMALARRDTGAALRGAGAFTLGVAVVLGLTVLPFALAGSFDAFWELMVDFILDYAAHRARRPSGVPRWLTHPYGLYAVIGCVVALLAGLAVARAGRDRRELRTGAWIFALLLGAAGSVLIQKRVFSEWGFTYHFIAMVPFLALGLSWGLRRALPRAGVAQLASVAALVAALFWFAPRFTFGEEHSYRKEWPAFWAHLRGELGEAEYHAPHRAGRLESHLRLAEVAREIDAAARPGDTLCVDGFIAELYSLTRLRCPSRFIIGDGVGQKREWHAEYAAMLERTPPTFFVTFPDRPRVRQLLGRGYRRRDLRVDGVTYSLLELRREPAEPR